MPGKINPTQAEALVQVCLKVIGNDATISMAGFYGGQLDLHTAKPLLIHVILESIKILANAMHSFADKAVHGLTVNTERINYYLEQSLMLATALTPYIGYDHASKLALQAYNEGKTIRELVLENHVLPEELLNEALNMNKLAFPHQTQS